MPPRVLSRVLFALLLILPAAAADQFPIPGLALPEGARLATHNQRADQLIAQFAADGVRQVWVADFDTELPWAELTAHFDAQLKAAGYYDAYAEFGDLTDFNGPTGPVGIYIKQAQGAWGSTGPYWVNLINLTATLDIDNTRDATADELKLLPAGVTKVVPMKNVAPVKGRPRYELQVLLYDQAQPGAQSAAGQP
jgi:hypothetical protein